MTWWLQILSSLAEDQDLLLGNYHMQLTTACDTKSEESKCLLWLLKMLIGSCT